MTRRVLVRVRGFITSRGAGLVRPALRAARRRGPRVSADRNRPARRHPSSMPSSSTVRSVTGWLARFRRSRSKVARSGLAIACRSCDRMATG